MSLDSTSRTWQGEEVMVLADARQGEATVVLSSHELMMFSNALNEVLHALRLPGTG